jgi:hypothetical protein
LCVCTFGRKERVKEGTNKGRKEGRKEGRKGNVLVRKFEGVVEDGVLHRQGRVFVTSGPFVTPPFLPGRRRLAGRDGGAVQVDHLGRLEDLRGLDMTNIPSARRRPVSREFLPASTQDQAAGKKAGTKKTSW